MDQDVIIRQARAKDVAKIVDAAISFSSQAYPNDEPDREHIEIVIVESLLNVSTYVMETDRDEFAGCFVGSLGKNALSGKNVLAEVFLWVEPQFRGHGKKLTDFAEAQLRKDGGGSFVLSCPENCERAGETFAAWGFVPTERWYRKEIR